MKLLACVFALAALFLAATALPAGEKPSNPNASDVQTPSPTIESISQEELPETSSAAVIDESNSDSNVDVEKRHSTMEKRAESESEEPQAKPLEQQQQQPPQDQPAQAPSQPTDEQTSEDLGDEEMSDRDMLDLLEYFNHDAATSQINDQDVQLEDESASESRKKRSVSESGMSAMAAAERKKRSIEEIPVERKKRSLDGQSETAAERLLEQVRLLEMREALRRRLEEEYANDDESSSAEDSYDEDAELQKRSEYEERPHSMLLRVAGEPGLFVPLEALRSDDEEEESSSAESSEEDVPMTKRGYDAENYESDDSSGESDELDESEEDERKRELMRELIQAKLREQELNGLRSEVEDSSSESSEDEETELRKRAYAEDEEDEDDDDSDENTELRRELIREYMVLDSLARALAANRD